MAQRWVDEGASWLHIVDLDGAKAGRPINGASVRRIVEASGVPCQLGGGIRSDKDLADAWEWGIERVVIGTRAIQAPEWLEAASRRWPNRIALGIDAKDGRVAAQGWLEVSEVLALDLARRCSAWPLAAIVFTDIGRDGMMAGANVAAMAEMVATVNVPVIASGGVTTLEDVKKLAEGGLAGCIIGRALYEGKIDLKNAMNFTTGKMTPGVGNGQL